MSVKKLLIVGCGPKGVPVPREFAAYRATRLDANKAVEPDIVASIISMPIVEDASYDAAFASHVIEHLYFHEVSQALAEIHRVLVPGGIIKIAVPDLQSIGSAVALDKADTMVYQGGLGPVAPLDMLYGHRGEVAKGNLLMAHKTGFTASVLKVALQRAGFVEVETNRDTKFELVATARKESSDAIRQRSPEALPMEIPSGHCEAVVERVSGPKELASA